ncbi:MAG TPA: hypothetical protein VHX64_04060 [Caulobacteraceae bacterium]|nr:hypothetical protein [Caulobacteraceae bacterium]
MGQVRSGSAFQRLQRQCDEVAGRVRIGESGEGFEQGLLTALRNRSGRREQWGGLLDRAARGLHQPIRRVGVEAEQETGDGLSPQLRPTRGRRLCSRFDGLDQQVRAPVEETAQRRLRLARFAGLELVAHLDTAARPACAHIEAGRPPIDRPDRGHHLRFGRSLRQPFHATPCGDSGFGQPPGPGQGPGLVPPAQMVVLLDQLEQRKGVFEAMLGQKRPGEPAHIAGIERADAVKGHGHGGEAGH